MSILQDLRTRARHRGKTPWQLVQTIGRLEREADEATCQMVALATEVDELRGQRNELTGELDKAAIDYDELLGDRDTWRDQALALQDRFGAQIAAEANASRITVPQMQRIGCDQDTAPTNVRPLWAARDAGLLGPVLDPGHTTTP